MKAPKTNLHKSGFPPVATPGSCLLILGSMPGEKSLEKQEYYAHPRNLFWPFIAGLANEDVPIGYMQKQQLLARLNIALWDVCDTCIRQGSLDTAILEETPNKLDLFLDEHPSVRTIAFNGQKAASLYRKYCTPRDGITYLTLPSTSPANAGSNMDDKRKAWMGLKSRLKAIEPSSDSENKPG
ncbi:MAG TPA: DNA-deoxyinosine glycosylase [Chitinophagaceae bacterium]|nr:DNA-deoxyinosine glycosylase [Chitinophagaceae bacterium]